MKRSGHGASVPKCESPDTGPPGAPTPGRLAAARRPRGSEAPEPVGKGAGAEQCHRDKAGDEIL